MRRNSCMPIRKVRDQVDPDFVRIAERDGVPCGFVFGIRDLEAEARGEKPAVIVKTLAVDPESRCAGLGSLLVDEVHAAAYEKGYTEAIHAMEHETNTSRKITGRYGGRVFRNYALVLPSRYESHRTAGGTRAPASGAAGLGGFAQGTRPGGHLWRAVAAGSGRSMRAA